MCLLMFLMYVASMSTSVLEYQLTGLFQYLPGSPGDANGQFYTGGEIQIEDDGKAYSGYGTYVGGWNNGKFPQ